MIKEKAMIKRMLCTKREHRVSWIRVASERKAESESNLDSGSKLICIQELIWRNPVLIEFGSENWVKAGLNWKKSNRVGFGADCNCV